MEHERNTQGDLADVVTGANEARPRAGGTARGHHQLQPPPAVFHGQIPSCDIPYSGLGHGPPLGAYLPASELAWAAGGGAGMAMAPHGAYVSPQQLLQISQAAAAAALPGEAAGGGEDGEEAMQISPQSHEMIKRKNLVKKVVCIPAPPPAVSGRPGGGEVIPSDLWAWRKYGQKPIKGSPYPRGYYRCSSSKGCMARKQVERSRSDPNMLVITYTAEHNHPWPMHRNVLAGYARSHTSTGKIKKKNLAANNSSATTASDHDHDHEGSSSSSSAHNVYCNNISSSFKNAVVIDGSSPDPDGESDQNAATAAGLYDPDHDELFAELEELETDASTVSLYYSKELASGGTTTTGSNDHKNSTMHPTFDMLD